MRFAYESIFILLLMSCSTAIMPIEPPAFLQNVSTKGKAWLGKLKFSAPGVKIQHAVQFPGSGKIKRFIYESFNSENAIYIGSMLALTVAVPYASSIVWKSIEQKILHPLADVVDTASYPLFGHWARLNRWWSGYKTPAIVFDSSVKERLFKIKEKTKNIRNAIYNGNKQATYTNLLLHGPSGTGKTIFARVLADYADMDFLPTKMSLLESPGAFNRLLNLATNSSYGAIIFIDEADGLFMDRSKLINSGAPDALAHYKLLNDILASIGQRSNKYMIIAATNFYHIIDEAMDRRFPDKIEMPLPDEQTRVALLNLYISNLIFDKAHHDEAFIKSAHAVLTPEYIQELAVRLAGFSHANIENVVNAIKDIVHEKQDSAITRQSVETIIAQVIADYKRSQENKRLRA